METVKVADLKKGMRQIRDAMDRKSAETAYINESLGELSKTTGVAKPVLRKLAIRLHKMDIVETTTTHDEMVELYATMTGT